jgi:hypothetical protein
MMPISAGAITSTFPRTGECQKAENITFKR